MSEKLNICDQVRLTEDQDDAGKKGMIGVIRGVGDDYENAYQVEFPEGFNGHSCSGLIKGSRGYNVDFDKVELVEPVTSTFRIGVRVKLELYTEYHDHEAHEGQSARVVIVEKSYLRVEWEDKTTSEVYLNDKSNPYIVDKLKDNKMEISMDDVKDFPKDVIKKAKANVLKARKEMQTEQAEVVLTGLLGVKDAIEEKIGEDQDALNRVTEDIKVFDVK